MGEQVTPLRVGMAGAGRISGQYLSTLARTEALRLTAVTDLDGARAEEAAAASGARAVGDLADLLARDDVDAVLNLTIPAVHADVALAAIAAGKHVYGEKPLATTREEAAAVLAAARAASVRVGCAPDTVLGTGVQTGRRAVDDGLIGTPVAATAFMTTPGHETWHPDPEFYYRPGGGPLLDMGPYYISALIHLLGPVAAVTGAASTPRAEREIASGPRAGQRFAVEVDTHVTGVLQHANGALSTLLMSFDIHEAHLPRIEVHGTEGSLSLPDPNLFDGVVEVWRARSDGWRSLPVSAGHPHAGRGIGLADLAVALATGRPHLASAELAEHVLDVMLTLLDAAHQGRTLTVTTTCERPAPVA
ncbi:Gfo/Idh/MocA family protein [Streptomyces pseudovenezuelae]|uniref:Dehydrogenase n=1 Tax=Streptomyces pseudovenezuelae TaxID=67350 RepID=A0ABT6LUR8_9ACTN|nr:Gfo/Idh/MocA family oxidoreductase [Streptomyces pseudovenezuelae]MDH6219625.1 putative dehydrogenase [Streptomyces pseudovenezuelae]